MSENKTQAEKLEEMKKKMVSSKNIVIKFTLLLMGRQREFSHFQCILSRFRLNSRQSNLIWAP